MATAHKHATIITEWAKDPTRPIEMKLSGLEGYWRPKDHPEWREDHDYRFADQKKSELMISSSLSDAEIHDVLGAYESGIDSARALANVAARRAIRDLRVPTVEWMKVFFRRGEGLQNEPGLILLGTILIGCYLEDVRAGEL